MTKRALISDLTRDSGDFERYCDATWRLPSKVEVVTQASAMLAWRPGGKQRKVTRGLLERFIELRNASPEKIAAFARRAGMLELRENPIEWAVGKPLPPGDWYESVAHWCDWAAAAWAALDITAHLKSGIRPPTGDWKMLFQPAPLFVPGLGVAILDDRPMWGPEYDATFLQDQINRFLEVGKVQPILDWKQGIVRYKVRGVVGAIALQLLLIATGAESWVTCSGCGRPYQPRSRAPKSGQRAFCPPCRRTGVPEKIAAQDYRRRKRQLNHITRY